VTDRNSRTPKPGMGGYFQRSDRTHEMNVKRLVAACVLFCTVSGCSAGGFVPGGPHSMSASRLNRIVVQQAQRAKIPPKLIAAVIKAESGGDPIAVSRAGAQGLMQLMPSTALLYGVLNPFDPVENIAGGASYLRDLLKRYHHNVSLALAAYNAGPGAVDAAGGIPAFLETRSYVARVTSTLHNER
jgi:soluble lytic murein transglycosylase-like protein